MSTAHKRTAGSTGSWLLFVLLGWALILTAPSAQAQMRADMPAMAVDDYGNPSTANEPYELAPGESHTWAFSPGPGSVTWMTETGDEGVTLDITIDGATFESGEMGVGQIYSQFGSDVASNWEVTVTAPPDRAISYTFYWYLQEYSDWDNDNAFYGDSSADEWANGDGYGPQGGLPPINPGALLDLVLDFAVRVLLPFLALLIVQSIAVFFVLRFMMRPSSSAAVSETLAPIEAPPAGAAADALAFHEVSHIDEVPRDEGARRRLKRLRRNNAFSRWWFLFGLAIFLLASLILSGGGLAPVIQLVIAGGLWILFAVIGRPLGWMYALLTILLLAAAPLGLFRAGLTDQTALLKSLAAVAGLALVLTALLLINLSRARKSGKQDLLVLRVFGMDRAAEQTFSTVARAWSFLGACATIADPSYVRFQMSGMRGNIWKFVLVSLATGLAVAASMFPVVQSLMPPGLTEQQQTAILTLAAFVVLIPFVVLPVFLSVRSNFMTEIDKLVAKIGAMMGPKLRASGYYKHRAFFCHDDMWRPAVHKMMHEAEVLLLDFRGFEPANLGCAYEIGKVLDQVAIERAVLLVDTDTDTDVLYGIFKSCWEKLSPDSPNRGNPEPVLNVFRARKNIRPRDGAVRWLVSRILLRNWRCWRQDSLGVLALLSTARRDAAALA